MNKLRRIPLAAMILLILLLSLIPGQHAAAGTPPADKIPVWDSGYWYLLGINYPWLDYGHDFGTTAWGHDGVSAAASKAQVDADFTYLKSQGVHVVRWFVFADCRAAPEFTDPCDPNATVTGFDDYVYDDLDTAVAIAQKHDMYLVLVLFDYLLAEEPNDVNGVRTHGRSRLISDPTIRQSFLDNALRPLLERYGQDRHILAWDVMNEPEGAMTIPDGNWVDESVDAATMQSFVNDVVSYIHTYSSQQATIGSAARQFLGYWTGSNLDFYQYHYYDKMESSYPLDYACADLSLDKPCIVGEFPTNNTSRTMTEYLNSIWNNGYAGALPWSYWPVDANSNFPSGADEFRLWSQAHHEDVDIRVKLPVYRFWSPTRSRHFYTAGASEKRKLIDHHTANWTYEDVAYYAWSDDGEPNTLPVHRFLSTRTGSHFYTIREAERNKLINNYPDVWTYEGIAFYAYPDGLEPAEANPVYRFWSDSKSCHFYTMSQSERAKLINEYSHVWTDEGIAWYACE